MAEQITYSYENWDEDVPRMSIEDMPIDDPLAYYDWLKRYHSYEYVKNLPSSEQPQAYDYNDLSPEEIGRVMAVIKQQRDGDEGIIRHILSQLSPVDFARLLREDPEHYYTNEEAAIARTERLEAETTRLAEIPAVQHLIELAQTGNYSFHATPYVAPDIFDRGLLGYQREGLGGVAIPLHGSPENMLDEIVHRHRSYENIVIVETPPNEALVPLTEEESNTLERGYDAYVPSRYIVGSINLTTGEFTYNNHYELGEKQSA